MGKFYTINCSKVTSGRGFGDPLSMLIDKADNEEIIFSNLFMRPVNSKHYVENTHPGTLK